MIEISLLIALTVLFFHATTWDGMIADRVRYETEDWPAWIKKPLYDCPVCMTPWYGALYLLGSGYPLVGTIMCITAAAGFNVIIQQLFIFRKNCNCGKEKDKTAPAPESKSLWPDDLINAYGLVKARLELVKVEEMNGRKTDAVQELETLKKIFERVMPKEGK